MTLRREAKQAVAGLFLAALVCLAGGGCSEDRRYEATVKNVMGRHLEFEDGRVAALVGIQVPLPGRPNYDESVFRKVRSLLLGKTVTVRTVEERHEVGYPAVELVEVFLDEMNVNHFLLQKGMAFFYEDHWDRGEKKQYRWLEQEARNQNRGFWENQEDLEVLFVRPRNGRFIHYPACPHVKDLADDEIVKYYVSLPRTPFMAARFAYFCDFCRPLFEEEFGLSKKAKEKVKLEKRT